MRAADTPLGLDEAAAAVAAARSGDASHVVVRKRAPLARWLDAGELRDQLTRTLRDGKDVRLIAGGVLAPVSSGLRSDAIVVINAHRHMSLAARWAAGFALRLGQPVHVNCYLTRRGPTGLTTHCDGHDVFALQLHGTKAWFLGDDYPETILAPGDGLYVRQGKLHRAESVSFASVHLTLGFGTLQPLFR
jgi:hypothetical protein